MYMLLLLMPKMMVIVGVLTAKEGFSHNSSGDNAHSIRTVAIRRGLVGYYILMTGLGGGDMLVTLPQG